MQDRNRSHGGGGGRVLRSITNLHTSASSARALNLVAVWERTGDQTEYRERPFFKSPILNRSIIVKHRLRPNELELFSHRISDATKVILPLDITNLDAGARSFFVLEKNWKETLRQVCEVSTEQTEHDESLLTLLDSLPSLDPYLMRERIKKTGYNPARLYFELSTADSGRIFQFARQELSALVDLLGGSSGGDDVSTKLAKKILANDSDADLEPLRQCLSLDRPAFEEGMFCWKGFIYYKWNLSDLLPKVKPVSEEIGSIKPFGPATHDEQAFIQATRTRLSEALLRACRTVRASLRIYDDAFADLTRNGQPMAFRAFLLNAPSLFYELGERLGTVQHIVSYWRYRFPDTVRPRIGAEELYDLLADFDMSINSPRTKETEVPPPSLMRA